MITLQTLGPIISLQEVPGEISLVFQITGCPHQCPGCHSSELWKHAGVKLSELSLEEEFSKYKDLITCVCFFGGEWAPKTLVSLLKKSQAAGYKTCLYTGAQEISQNLYSHLNYLKIGPWIEAQGGLNNKNTNQVFYDLDKKITLNHLFQSA